jgi:hypothetical protein
MHEGPKQLDWSEYVAIIDFGHPNRHVVTADGTLSRRCDSVISLDLDPPKSSSVRREQELEKK